MWKIQSCEVCEFCMLLYYARGSVTTFRKCGNAFPRVIYYKSIQKSQTSHDCIFHILRYFSTKLHNFTKFMMLFPAVLMNFPNSEVCLIGEWLIYFSKDWLGLKEMDAAGKLHFLGADGDHLRFTQEFFETKIFPFLK